MPRQNANAVKIANANIVRQAKANVTARMGIKAASARVTEKVVSAVKIANANIERGKEAVAVR